MQIDQLSLCRLTGVDYVLRVTKLIIYGRRRLCSTAGIDYVLRPAHNTEADMVVCIIWLLINTKYTFTAAVRTTIITAASYTP